MRSSNFERPIWLLTSLVHQMFLTFLLDMRSFSQGLKALQRESKSLERRRQTFTLRSDRRNNCQEQPRRPVGESEVHGPLPIPRLRAHPHKDDQLEFALLFFVQEEFLLYLQQECGRERALPN